MVNETGRDAHRVVMVGMAVAVVVAKARRACHDAGHESGQLFVVRDRIVGTTVCLVIVK